MLRNVAVLLMLLCSQTVSAAVGIEVKRDAVVPDEATAIAIAKAVLTPIFGADFNQHRQRIYPGMAHTFYASPYRDRWIVEDAPPSRLSWVQPILRVEIDRKHGRIMRISEY